MSPGLCRLVCLCVRVRVTWRWPAEVIDPYKGLQAVKQAFLKYPDNRRPDRTLLTLLEINLTKNDFTFNGQTYLQFRGTAMGKRFAPSYANIFMAGWEQEALTKSTNQPYFYCRNLDDIFCVWTYSSTAFDEIVTGLNK